MRKTNQTERVGMVLLTMLLLFFGACKRNELQPPMPSVLNSYQGTDKMVLQVIETLREPVNKALLAELEKQGGISWEYDALITSRFLQGLTLRFATGSDGNYLDAEIDARTRAIKLYSKQQQGQRDAMARQALNGKPNVKAALAGPCTFNIAFEIRAVNRDEAIDAIFALVMVPWFVKHLEAIGFQAFGYKFLTFTGNKTSEEIEQMLRYALGTVFSGGLAQYIMLEITNSCGDESGDNPNLPINVSIQEVSPAKPMPFGRYGAVDREKIEIVIGCYKGGNVWRAVLKSLKGYYAVKAALLYGVKEVTGIGGNTTATNYCQQITDLKALGFDENLMPTQWYMLGAVWAHERVHVNSLLPSLSQSVTEIKANLYNITVPFTGQSYSIAKNQINDLAGMFLIEEITLGIWIRNHNDHAGIEHRLGGSAEQVELNFMRPMINQICGSAKLQLPPWPNCAACP